MGSGLLASCLQYQQLPVCWFYPQVPGTEQKKRDTMRRFLFKKSLMLNCIKTWSFLSSKGTTKRIKKASQYEGGGRVCVFLVCMYFFLKIASYPKSITPINYQGKFQIFERRKGNNVGRHVIKENSQIVNKHVKNCSRSLVIREIQIAVMMQYQAACTGMAKIDSSEC